MRRKTFTNVEIASLLRKVAAAYEVKGGNKFKIMAYSRAADAIEHATSEAKDLWDDGKLNTIPGVGASIAQHLDELFKKGRVKHFEAVTRGLPRAMFPLIDVPGFGPKTAYKLVRTLKISNPKTVIDDLLGAATRHKICPIEGFGEKSEQAILENLSEYRQKQKKPRRFLLPHAFDTAERVIVYLKKCPQVIRADPLGSLRRMVSTVGDIDIAVATDNSQLVIDHFLKYPEIKKVLVSGGAKASVVLKNGRQVDLRVQESSSYGSLLQYFTGSKHHNIHLREMALKRGLSLSEYGIKKEGKLTPCRTEEEFYHDLGLPWIPPEIREDTGEIEAAMSQRLPHLVEPSDIKGDLHVHSNFNIEPSHDLGISPLRELALKAYQLGYEYLGLAEHNPSISRHSKNEIIELIKRRNERIEQYTYSRKNSMKNRILIVLKLLEVDILASGKLSVPDEGLKILDGAIAAVHTAFSQSREKMTRRVLNALKNPYVRILAHPTGRILNKREGYELDWEKIFELCLKKDKALEINAWPTRLDLPDTLVREAVKSGVKLIINTDAHAVEEMELMRYGVSVARRGWTQKGDILNTLSYNKFVKWLRKRS